MFSHVTIKKKKNVDIYIYICTWLLSDGMTSLHSLVCKLTSLSDVAGGKSDAAEMCASSALASKHSGSVCREGEKYNLLFVLDPSSAAVTAFGAKKNEGDYLKRRTCYQWRPLFVTAFYLGTTSVFGLVCSWWSFGVASKRMLRLRRRFHRLYCATSNMGVPFPCSRPLQTPSKFIFRKKKKNQLITSFQSLRLFHTPFNMTVLAHDEFKNT